MGWGSLSLRIPPSVPPFLAKWDYTTARDSLASRHVLEGLPAKGFADAGAVDPLEYEKGTSRIDRDRLKGDNPGHFVVAELVEEDALEEAHNIVVQSKVGDA